MKYFLLALLFVVTSAFAQTDHMIEMSTSSTALGAFTFTDSGSSNTSTSGFVGANYAYKISPRIQLAAQGNYSRFHQSSTIESYNFLLGAIFNFDDDLTETFYASLYAGMGWSHFSGDGNFNTETGTGRAAFGKRFALKSLNLPNVTYSPEISYTRNEYTQSSYGNNSYSIRFLQFSVFF